MDDENIGNELRKISKVMDGFSLETVKIANIQTELCTVTKENAVLKENVAVLMENVAVLKENVAVLTTELCTVKKENTDLSTVKNDLQGKVDTLSTEVKTLSDANTVLKNLYRASLENVSKLDGEYKDLKNCYDKLRSDVDILKSASEASKVEHCNKIKSDVDGGGTLLSAVDTEGKSVGDCDDEATNEPAGAQKHSNLGIKRKPKAQKKREQNETFRQWGQLMNQRKTPKVLWASGLLKFTVELWEDEDKFMNEDEILDFLKKKRRSANDTFFV